ncbi:MAG: hypothetical protein Q4F67_08300 [Propionibacteriaceae bacterium]|nr:hypothetical protein [Propionibacteriaceae bacterium]
MISTPGPRPVPPPGADRPGTPPGEAPVTLPPAHPEVQAALADLTADLPELSLAQHHDRYVAVLELLHEVLEESRSR